MDELTRKTVLVVDDEEIIRNFLFEVLSEEYEVSLANDGDEAINQLRNKSFDVVITDLKMPRISGEEVVRFAVENDPTAKVIVISGFSSLYTVSQSINNGACSFLSKPFSIDELKQTVSGAMNE